MPQMNVGNFAGRRKDGIVVKPKNFKGTLRRLWEYFGREKKIFMIIFAFILVDSGLTLAAPYLIGRSVDAMTMKNGAVDFKVLDIMVVTLTLAYVSDAFINFLQGWLMAGVSQRIVKNLRETLFAKLQKLPISFFDTNTHGDIMSRLSNDIENVSSTVSQSTIQLMSGMITIVGSLVMMLVLSPLLTLASIITIPLVFLLTRTIAKKTSKLFKEQQRELGMLNGHIEENITGIHAAIPDAPLYFQICIP